MKKFLTLVCAAAALILFTVPASAAEYPELLRVGIYYSSSAVGSLNLKSESGFSLGTLSDRSFSEQFTLQSTALTAQSCASGGGFWCGSFGSFGSFSEANAKCIELSASGIYAYPAYVSDEIRVVCGPFSDENSAADGGATAFLLSGSAIRLNNSDQKTVFVFDSSKTCLGIYPAGGKAVTIDGAAGGAYRGGFELKASDSTKLALTNLVPTEEYLYGVVSREMSPSWNIEALKAQAVCARNFALGRINYHSKYGFDVCRTTCCQAYSGMSAENDSVRRAVDKTRGELLLYNGEPIQAVYSSSMGSCTESVENVWGTPFPYLVSVDNPYEDTENIYNGKWTKTLTRSRATEIMNSRGYSIGEVLDIQAVEYTAAGRVLKLKVIGTNGEKTFEREACRSIFSEVTYSQKYTVTRGGTAAYPSVFCFDGSSSAQKTLNTVSVLSSSGITTLGVSCCATDGSVSKSYVSSTSSAESDSFVFDGEGWGHGVGMSQYGAKGMADAGFKYSDILTHFYTGTYLEKVY